MTTPKTDLSVIPTELPEHMPDREPVNCPDCGAAPGAYHSGGCDVERCPCCGGQSIGCDCIYEMCGIDVSTMDETHPEIYMQGPTEAMYEAWDAAWTDKRKRWTGYWPGTVECWERGWVCRTIFPDGSIMSSTNKLTIDRMEAGDIQWHVPCNPEDEGADADVNRWAYNVGKLGDR